MHAGENAEFYVPKMFSHMLALLPLIFLVVANSLVGRSDVSSIEI